MNKNRKISHILNVLQYNESTDAITVGNSNGLRAFNIYSSIADNHLAIYGPAPSVSMSDAPIGTWQTKFGMATANGQYANGTVAGDFVIISQSGAIHFSTNGVTGLKVTSTTSAFSGSVTANSFIINGGASNGFLKADGSVDSTAYATVASVSAISSSLSSDYVTLSTNQTVGGFKTFTAGVYVNGGILINNASTAWDTGYIGIGATTTGLRIGVASGVNQILTFPTAASYTYTFPSTTGTIALTSNLSAYVPTTRTISINGTSYDLSTDRSWSITNSSLGAQPQLNGTGFVKISGTTISYDNSTYLTGITSSQVTTALGYTPYNSTNPSGYITSSGTAAAISQTIGANGDTNLVYAAIADNDFFRIRVGGSSNAGWVEIATADDGTEPIYVRQYTGVFSSLTRTLTLLDGSGNTSTPGSLNVGGYLTVTGAGTSSSIYMSDSDEGQREIHCNSNRIGFLTQAGAWGAWCDDSGNWNAANFSGSHSGTSSGTNTGDQTNISGKADGAVKLWAASHPNDYYIVNNWTGSYWQLTTNHGSGVQVAYANNAGNASSANNADTVDGYHYDNFPGKNGNSYYQVATWLQLTGEHGLYCPSVNNAHFYPNTRSYGSWKVLGERNGWRGIHFGEGTGMTLMMNETEFGFHREGYGWYARFTNGTGYFNISGTSSDTSSIGSAVGNGYTWTGTQYFLRNNGGQAVNNSNTAALQAYSTGNNTAFMSFHRAGYYAVNFGLDDDNWMRIGGWSSAANRFQFNTSSGDFVCNGDVTAFSDARVKENIVTVDNALSKVLALRGVYYNRIDSDDKSRKIGVIAQETLPVIPEVVNTDAFGTYNVSYGNLGGLFIEAFKEQDTIIKDQAEVIKGLQDQIDVLKFLVDGLTK